MAAFNNAGGEIEVLGNTPFRPKISPVKRAAANSKALTSAKPS